MNKTRLADIGLLIIIGLVMVIIVNPIGNFPLDDDFMYSRPVSFLVNKGFYYSPDLYSPVLAAQVIWASLFCLPFGFSFTALRISVLVLAFVCIIVFYFLVNRFTGNRRLSVICAMLLLVNPLFFALSNTFMTDVPFLTFALIALFFFSKAIDSPELKYVLPAIVFSVIATLIRQFGIVIPIAYGLIQMIKNKPSLSRWVKYFLPAVIAILALKITIKWIEHIGSQSPLYNGSNVVAFLDHPGVIVHQIFQRTGFLLYYCGVLLFPVLLIRGFKSFRNLTSRQKIAALLFLLPFVPSLIYGWSHVPLGNIVNGGYLGPKTLRDVSLFWLNDLDKIPPVVQFFLSFIGLTGSILLLINVAVILIRLRQPEKVEYPIVSSFQKGYILVCIIGYAFLMCIPDFFFDRYLLPFMPFMLLLLVSQIHKEWKMKRFMLYFSTGYIILLGAFSSLATHDYLQWNRTRWQALHYLTKEMKISPYQIDGGYEYNGWALQNVFPQSKGKSWWCVYDDEYIISFGNMDGYTVFRQFPYQNYFPYETRNIYVLHRK